MGSWTRNGKNKTKQTEPGYYKGSEKSNINPLNLNVMSTKSNSSKNADSKATAETKAKATSKAKTPAKKSDEKAKETKAKTPAKPKKGPGVIASIREFVEAGPVAESDLVKKLEKRFPEKDGSSMLKTVKAQIGSNKRPVRMERELAAKGIKWNFDVTVNKDTKEKTYSAKVGK